jgi:glycerol uptake facilitator-like aquaporin
MSVQKDADPLAGSHDSLPDVRNKPAAKDAAPVPIATTGGSNGGAVPEDRPAPRTVQVAAPGAAGASDLPPSDVTNLLSVPAWIRLHPLLGNFMAEGLGVFTFVLTIAMVEINNPVPADHPETNVSPIPIGSMLMCMALTFGYISGAHLNPAVTFACILWERGNIMKYLVYMICQVGAAVGSGIVAMIIKGDEMISVPDVTYSGNVLTQIRKAILAELIYTFALATTVMNTLHRKREPSVFLPMALGMVVTAGASAVGGVSGGAFNPAVATGLQLAVCFAGRCDPVMHFWLYWLAPCVGGILGVIVFKNLHSEEANQPPIETGATELAPQVA